MTAPVPGITLTFEEGTEGADLIVGGSIASVTSPSQQYAAAAKIHGNLGLTGTSVNGSGPYFQTNRPASWADVNKSHTVSAYFIPVSSPSGAFQICSFQAASNQIIGLLRFNVASKKVEIAVNGLSSGGSSLTWAFGTKYRCDASYDGSTNTFTVKVFAGANAEGSVPDDTFTAVGVANPSPFDHWLFSSCRSTGGGVGYLDTIRLYDGVVTPASFAPPVASSATVVHRWVGAPTSGGFRIKAKLTGATSVKIAASLSADMANPVYSTPGAPDANGYVDLSISGLVAGTRYYYQLVDTPVAGLATLLGTTGRARTLPAGNSHRVAFGSCVTTNATDPSALNDIVAWDPDLFIHLGDFDYSGDQSTDPTHQRTTYESQILGAAGLSNLLANVPWAYTTSDHEAGPDNGDSNNAYTAANITAYKQIVPTYPLGDSRSPTIGRYQSWVIGRVRYIMVDTRNTDRSPGANTDDANKTMLGATQKAWLKARLLDPEPVKVILSDPGWMGNPTTTNGPDKWWAYSTERAEIINFIAANGVKCLLWHGDTHAVAVATPAKNTWGGFPVYCSSPLRNVGGGLNLSTFSSYFNNGGAASAQYGRVTVTDTGTAITFTYSGWDALAGTERVTQTDVFTLVDNTPPTTPVIVSATPLSPTSARITWSASADAGTGVASYRVKRNGAVVADAITSGATFTDNTLTPQTAYSYTVSAVDAAGNRSVDSDPFAVTTPAAPDVTAPTVPLGLTAPTIESTSVKLDWLPSSDDVGVTGYRVLRNGVPVATGLTTTAFIDNTVQPLTHYIYSVSAVDAAGNRSAESETVAVDTTAPPVITPVTPVPGLTTVIHRLLDIDGNPIVGMTVTVTLMLRLDVAPDSYNLNAPDPFTGQPIARTVSSISDSDGLLSWNLVPNDQIVPAGTYYEVHGLGVRTFLYVASGAFAVEMSECVLTLVDLGSSNLVLVQGPRGRQGGDSSGGLGMPSATTALKGILQLAGDLDGTADAPTVISGAHHGHTSAQISDATNLNTPNTVIRRDENGDFFAAGLSFTGVDNSGQREPVFYNPWGGDGNALRFGNVHGALRVLPYNDDTTYIQTSQNNMAFSGLYAVQGIGLSFNFATTTFTGTVISGSSADPTSAAQLAPKAYVDRQVATRAAIAGDLGGTPANPTVPGLATKANASHTHSVVDLTATGTRDSTKFLRGDNTWQVPPTTAAKNTTVTLSPAATDYWQKIEIIDDGTATASWPNRFEAAFTPSGGTRGLTTYLNEYGELRVEPAKSNTVAARFFTKHAPTDAAHTVNIWELMDDRTTRTVLAYIDSVGNGVFANLPRKMSVASAAPSSPVTGDVWIDTSA